MSGGSCLLRGAAGIFSAALAIAGFLAPAAAQAPSPLVFRHIYVPEGELASEIRGLLPMKREEFDQRLRAAQQKSQRTGGPPAARIDAATFRARFDGTALIEGYAALTVVATTDEPTLLPLQPCNLALEAASWRRVDEQTAVIGADPEGRLQCLVEGSGVLLLDWSCPAAAINEGETLVTLQLPPAVSRRLEIMAPAALELSASNGLITANKATGGDGGERLWTVAVNGDAAVKLRFRPRETKADSQPLMTVRESTTYSVLRSQVDVESTFLIDVLQRAAEEVQLHCDSSLQISEIRLGDASVPFSIDERPERGPAKIHIALPTPLTGLHQTLHIVGSADWPTTGRWNLPRIHVAGAIYQEGQAEITAPPWLRIDVRPISGCTTTLMTPAAAGRTQEKFTLQLFAADSAIAISAEPMPAPLREESGLQVVVESNQVNGVLVAELTSLASSQFEAQARIPRQWIVDAVETQPPDMLADRFLDARSTGPQLLRLRLNRPLTASRPLRLVIRAHYRRPANGQPLGESLFRLATFPDARDSRRLVAVRVADPAAELRLGGSDHLERLDPAQLSPADARLFESPPGGMLFLPSAGAERFAAVLQPTTARYQADVAVQAEIDDDVLRSTVNLHCEPEGPAVATVTVRLAPRPSGPIAWRLRGEEDRELPATLESSPAGGAADEVVYRLLLARPQTAAFDIVGQWTNASALSNPGKTNLPLAWAPEAVAQSGVIEVLSPNASLLVEASDAEPLPRPAATDRLSAELRARYRYTLGRQPRIAVSAGSARRGPQGAWIERLELASRFAADGLGQHEATLHVGNAGATTLRVRLPAAATDVEPANREATIDGDPSGQEDTLVTFRLPPTEQQCVVRLRYTSQNRPLGCWPVATLTAPIPQPQVAVLERSWTVSLPPDLAMDGSRSEVVPSEEGDAKQDGSSPGWSMVQASLPSQGDAILRLHRPLVLLAWAVCAALVACAASSGPSRLAWWLWPLLSLAASAALLFLGPLAWTLVGAACGSSIGSLLRVLRYAFAGRSPLRGPIPERTTVLLSSGSAAGSLLLLLALAQTLLAAPQDAATPAATPTHRVVIPVNDQQQPTGDYVYLDPAFYDALHRATQTTSRAAPPWLLERARYDVTNVTFGVGARPAVGELLLALDFHTFTAAETMSLPLARSEILLLESRARLDGRPISLVWRGDGSALLVPVEAAGKHRLELAVGAVSKSTGGTVTLDVAVPPAAMRSVLGSASIHIDASAGIEKPAMAGTREVLLGPSPRLVVHWTSPQDAALAAATLEADQLLWWKIRPGSVTVQGRFRLRPLPGPVQEAVVHFDPRLRLLPGLASGAIGRLAVEEGEPSRVRITLDSSSSEPTFQLTWLWPEASGIGTLVLPRITVEADRLLRNWLGVSLDSRLALGDLPGTTHTTPLDFAGAWGDGATAPLAVVEPHGGQAVQLSLHSNETTPTTDQTTRWSVASTVAQVAVSAALKDVSPGRWAQRFKMPPQLRVRTVTLLQADRPAAHRWSQSADGTLLIALLEPPAAEQALQITAELPIRGVAQLTLPLIEASDTRYAQTSLEIYRQHDVVVSVPAAPHWANVANARLGEYVADSGRLVASLRSTSDAVSAPVSIEIAPNKPRLSGQMMIRAAQADGDWRGEAHLHLNVADGLLDELRLSIPERWAGPLEIDPPMPQQRESFTGESRRQLLLRPVQPVSGHLDLTLRGPLHSAGGGIQAPDIAVLGDWQIERLVRLDRELAGERIDWQVSGLVLAPADLGAKLQPAWRSASGDLYRVTAPRFDATARSEQLTPAAPRVPLADIRLSVKPGRRVIGRATFTILPGLLRELRLSLPPESRLVQTLIDGRAVTAVPAGLRTWGIPAPSPRLPCQLTVLYDAALPLDGSSGIVAAPQLAGLTAEHSLWSLEADSLAAEFSPDHQVRDPSSSEGPPTSTAIEDAELLRLEAAVEALESVLSAQASDLPIADLRENFRRRRAEYERCRLVLSTRLYSRSSEETNAETHHLDRLEAAIQRATRVQQRLSIGEVTLPQAADPPAENALLADSHLVTSLAAAGMRDRVGLRLTSIAMPEASSSNRTWSLAMLALAMVGLGSLSLHRRPWRSQ